MGFKIKGLKKPFRNLTHSKIYKTISPFGHYGSKVRKKLGLTGHRLKKVGRQIKSGLFGLGSSGLNSANASGALIPAQVGSNKSVVDMF